MPIDDPKFQVAERESAETALRELNNQLESRVRARTEELEEKNQVLRRSQFFLSEGQRLAHTGSWAFDPAGFFDQWSAELFRIYGLNPAQGPPTLAQYLHSIHPQDRDFMARTIETMVAQQSGCDVKKRIVRPDGAVRHIRCVGIPVIDNGRFKGFVGTAMDVTEQEELTQQLRRREAYLSEAQRLSHTGSFGWNVATGEITYWSQECYRVLGFDPQGPLPRFQTLFQRLQPDDQASSRERLEKAIRDKTDFEGEYRVVHPQKGVRNIHSVAHAVLDRAGELVEFVGTVIDITERKRAEEELHQLVDLVPQLIAVMGPDGKFIHVNRVTREYTGLTLEEFRSIDVIGRTIHPDDVEKVRAQRKGGFLGVDPFEYEARLLGKDGVYRWFLLRYNPLVEQGRARKWYGTATEIESRKQEEERVRQENVRLEERTRIAQELHDTLLQSCCAATMKLGAAMDGLPSDSLLRPKIDSILQLFEQGIAEGRNAIQGLRSSNSGTLDLVGALSGIQQELATQPDVDFRVSVVGQQKPLRAPIREELYRIGREALVNAFSHSRAKRVELELEYTDSNLSLRVNDNGCGIDPQVLDKGLEGHWGLAGMRERTARLGGLLKISSSATAGTEIQLSIPGEVAFQARPDQVQ